MPEYWFRYGVTEVSVEIPEDVRQWRVGEAFGDPVGLEVLKDFVEGLEDDVTILYDHSGGRSVKVLRALIAELEAAGKKHELMVSAWRLDRRAAEEDCLKSLRGLGGFKTWSPETLRVSRQLVLVSEAEPHGVLGSVALKEVFMNERLWMEVLETWSPKAVCLVGRRLMVGDAEKVDLEARRMVEETYREEVGEQATIVIAGAGGWPRDATLETCLHVIGLLRPLVRDGGMLGFVAECRLGVGSQSFLQTLVGKTEDEASSALLSILKEIRERNVRIAFTSTLPKSLIGKILSSRSFDTVQELLSYGFRLYSRDATVTVAEESLRFFKARGEQS